MPSPETDEISRLRASLNALLGVAGRDPEADDAVIAVYEQARGLLAGTKEEGPPPSLEDAFLRLLKDVEAQVSDPRAYGMSIYSPDHPWHETIMMARKVRVRLERQPLEEAIEKAAKAIFGDNAFYPNEERKPNWVPRGNSFRQEEARSLALAALRGLRDG